MAFTNNERMKIAEVATQARKMLESKYGNKYDNLMGKCIEASDLITSQLQIIGFNAYSKQVWCLYENFESCSNYCYEEHWITVVEKGKSKIYIDTTITQFQWAFSKKLPNIWLKEKLPNFFLTRKPGKVTLDKCGWNDWYNYGDYVNKFNYYG